MIPLRDNNPTTIRPWVNWGLMAITGIVFLLQLKGPVEGEEKIIHRFGMIPQRVLKPETRISVPDLVETNAGPIRVTRRLRQPTFSPWWTILTCVFLHGGWLHFLGNMWFLHIFGDNIEDRFGHLGFLVFYLACGVGASLAHLYTNSGSMVPTVGASGAIAGVMGAYLLLYPRATVLTAIPLFLFIEVMVVPAYLFLGIWFAIQLLQGTLASGATGVAWWAHVGGFVVGAFVAYFLGKLHALRRPAVVPLAQSRKVVRRLGSDPRRLGPWRQ